MPAFEIHVGDAFVVTAIGARTDDGGIEVEVFTYEGGVS